jgi:hypothetical protein
MFRCPGGSLAWHAILVYAPGHDASATPERSSRALCWKLPVEVEARVMRHVYHIIAPCSNWVKRMITLRLMNVYFSIRTHKVSETTSVIEIQISENHSSDLIDWMSCLRCCCVNLFVGCGLDVCEEVVEGWFPDCCPVFPGAGLEEDETFIWLWDESGNLDEMPPFVRFGVGIAFWAKVCLGSCWAWIVPYNLQRRLHQWRQILHHVLCHSRAGASAVQHVSRYGHWNKPTHILVSYWLLEINDLLGGNRRATPGLWSKNPMTFWLNICQA